MNLSVRRLFALLSGFAAVVAASPFALATPPQAGRHLRIGIYSGTFDPPHHGHLSVLETARERLGLDVIYVVPNPLTPHKPDATAYFHRKRMAELEFHGPGIIVADPELEKAAENRQDTFEVLMKRYGPESEYFRILGEDSFSLYLQNPTKAKEHLNLVVVEREGEREGERDIERGDRSRPEAIPEKIGNSPVIVLHEGTSGYSSTQARATIGRGDWPDFVQSNVRAYIRANHLYGANPPKDSICDELLLPAFQ